MEINGLGTVSSSAYDRETVSQREAIRQQAQTETLEKGAEEQAAQTRQVPPSMPAGAQGGTAAAGQDTGNTARQSTAVQQAAAQADASAVTTVTVDEEDDTAYESIVRKADSGQALTGAELSTLKSKDPARYARAMRQAEGRDTLRREMEKAPSQAGRAAREAIGAAQDDPALARALTDEYQGFARHYDQVEFDSMAAAAALYTK